MTELSRPWRGHQPADHHLSVPAWPRRLACILTSPFEPVPETPWSAELQPWPSRLCWQVASSQLTCNHNSREGAVCCDCDYLLLPKTSCRSPGAGAPTAISPTGQCGFSCRYSSHAVGCHLVLSLPAQACLLLWTWRVLQIPVLGANPWCQAVCCFCCLLLIHGGLSVSVK